MATPTFWDIWNYHSAGGTGGFAHGFDPNESSGMGAGVSADIAALHNTVNPWLSENFGHPEGTHGTNYTFDTSKLPTNLQGIVQGVYSLGGGDDPKAVTNYQIDYSKLPKTKFGSLEHVALVDPHTQLINPALQYYDPNYGQITPEWNIKKDQVNSIVQSALMAAATGAALAPLGGMAAGLFKTVGQGILNGGKFDIGNIIGAAAQAMGMPGGSIIGKVVSLALGQGGKSPFGLTGSPNTKPGRNNPLGLILALAALAGKGGKKTGG